MIIVVCTDDNNLLTTAQQQSAGNIAVYGNCFHAFNDQIPQLGANENVFITAHGASRGDDGNPVIGDSNNAFYVNAVDLWTNISGIFPANYIGNVYISACESANSNNGLSFAEVFKGQIQDAISTAGNVFAQRGTVDLTIPLPTDNGWEQA